MANKKTAARRQLFKSVFKESSNFSFPSRKGTDFRVSRYWIFFGFRQDNEGSGSSTFFSRNWILNVKSQYVELFQFLVRVFKGSVRSVFLRMPAVFPGLIRFGFSSDADGFLRTGSFERFNNTKMRRPAPFT